MGRLRHRLLLADAEARRGTYYRETKCPWFPGREAAGVVEAVGADVRTIQPGDRVAALVLGARFLQCTRQLNRDRSHKAALRLFSYSITYLGLLFAAIAVDAVLQHKF